MAITILLAILVLEVGLLLWRHWDRSYTPSIPFPVEGAAQQPTQHATGQVELLQRDLDGNWCHHSWRPEGHRDILEAIATPGLAVRKTDGTFYEGMQ